MVSIRILALFVLLPIVLAATPLASGSWQEYRVVEVPTRMPHSMIAQAAATDGRVVYVMGGFHQTVGDSWEPIPAAWRFNAATWEWGSLWPIPLGGLALASSVWHNGTLVMIGGTDNRQEDPSSNRVLLLAADGASEVIGNLPTSRAGAVAYVRDGGLGILGGYRGGREPLSDHVVFDLQNRTWSSLSPLPLAFEGAYGAAVVLDEMLYLAGNGIHYLDTSRVIQVNLATGQSSFAPGSVPRVPDAAVATDGELIFLFGADPRKEPGADARGIVAYDPRTGQSWKLAQRLPFDIDDAAAVSVGGNMYIFGGNDQAPSDRILCFGPCEEPWRRAQPGVNQLPQVAAGRHAVQAGTRIDLRFTAHDPEGDPLTLNVTLAPRNAQVDLSTWSLAWQTRADDVGWHCMRAEATQYILNNSGVNPGTPGATPQSASAPVCITVFDGALDQDGDGVQDAADDCPYVTDREQRDQDGDGIGDACDEAACRDCSGASATTAPPRGPVDRDADGVSDTNDTCPGLHNASQADYDRDGVGDACDEDPDGDGANEKGTGFLDNCPGLPNPDQADHDQDGIGDACQDANPTAIPQASLTTQPTPARPTPTAPLLLILVALGMLAARRRGA